MIGQSPNNLDQIIEIDKGSDDGDARRHARGQPGGRLIGKITEPSPATGPR